MKVRATALGFYGNKRRRAGDVFMLKPFKRKLVKVDPKTKKQSVEIISVTAEEQFSDFWMELAESGANLKTSTERAFGPNIKGPKSKEQPAAAKSVHEPEVEDEDMVQEDDEAEGSTGDRSVI